MKKETKRLAWALGLILGLGILSVVYAALSSTLYIRGSGDLITGQVEFVGCQPVAIGTNDTTVNNDAGATLSGDTSGYTSGYSGGVANYEISGKTADTAPCLAFGKSVRISDWESSSGASGINISRSTNYQTSHDGDTLEIKGTELYDYGSYVIYAVDLRNTAKNPMYLSKVPTADVEFTSTDTNNPGTGNKNINQSVVVTFHKSLPGAISNSDFLEVCNLTQVGTGSSHLTNYLRGDTGTPDNTTWFIKIRRLTQGETDQPLVSGTFKFTVHLADAKAYNNNSGSAAHPAVWEATGRANASS